MDKALGGIGQLMLLQIVVALIVAIIEDLSVPTNATRTVESHRRNCTC